MLNKLNKLFLFILTFFTLIDGIYLRILMFLSRQGETGGDSYNILNMARSFTKLTYPLNEKRLPLYSLLLTPIANNPLLALTYAKVISLIFGILTIIFTLKLIWKLTKSPAALFISGILISFNTTLTLESVRVLSDSLFIFLCVISLYLFYNLAVKKKPNSTDLILFGLAIFSASMTRYEGLVVTLILLAFGIIRFNFKNRIFIFILVLYFVFMTIFFIKIPFFKLYFTDTGYGTYNISDIREKAQLAFENLKFLFFTWDINHLISLKSVVLNSEFKINKIISYIVLDWENISLNIFGISYLVMIFLGSIKLIKKYKLFGLTFLITLFGLYFIANWWMPRGRFYSSQIPLFLIVFSVGLSNTEQLISRFLKNKLSKTIIIVFAVLITISVYGSMREGVFLRIKSENIDTRENAKYIDLLKYLYSQKNALIISNVEGVEADYFLKDRIKVKDPSEIYKLKTKCKKIECFYFEANLISKPKFFTDTENQKIIKHVYLESKKAELTVFKLTNL